MAANDLPTLRDHGLGVQQAVRTLRMATHGKKYQQTAGRLVVDAESARQGHGRNRSVLARSVGA